MSLHWLPNALTVSRILLVAPIAYLIVTGKYGTALLIFLVAGITDALDGFLAKTFRWFSRIGGLLDPLADKLLLTSVFGALWVAGLLPGWLALLVILRDLIIVSGACAYHALIEPVNANPTRISKLNTLFELLLVLATLASAAYGWPSDTVILALGAAVFVTVIISGMDYVWSWSRKALVGE